MKILSCVIGGTLLGAALFGHTQMPEWLWLLMAAYFMGLGYFLAKIK